MAPLYLSNQKCVAACVVHVDGKAMMLHDAQTQKLSTSVTDVHVRHLQYILDDKNAQDPLMAIIRTGVDVERDPVAAAFAYAALENASEQFGAETVSLCESIGVHRADCALSNFVMGTNNLNLHMLSFSISIEPDRATLDDLSLTYVMVDRSKLIAKPSRAPGGDVLEVYFMGLRMTPLTGIVVLLFWDLGFT
jgi:hypothetical protein